MMNLTVIRQVIRNGCINGKLGRAKIAKDKTNDGKHTFSCTFFHGEFEKWMLSSQSCMPTFLEGIKSVCFLNYL